MKKLLFIATLTLCPFSLSTIESPLTDHNQDKLTIATPNRSLSDQKLQARMALVCETLDVSTFENSAEQKEAIDATPLKTQHILVAMNAHNNTQNKLKDIVDEHAAVYESIIAGTMNQLPSNFEDSWKKIIDKADSIQDYFRDFGDDLQDDFYELTAIVAAYRNYKLFTLGQENNDYDLNDIQNFIFLWGKSAEEKAAKRQAKEEKREARREEKQSRREEKQSRNSSSSQSPSNSSRSSNQTASPSHTSSSSNRSSQSVTPEPALPSKQNDAEKQDAETVSLIVPTNDERNYIAVPITPDILGNISYNPNEDPANNDQSDDTKISKKPEYTPSVSEKKPGNQFTAGMQKAVDEFGKQGPHNNEAANRVQSYLNEVNNRCAQKCMEAGFSDYLTTQEKQNIWDKSYIAVQIEMDNEKKAQRAQQEARDKEEREQKAEIRKIQNDMRKALHEKRESELAEDRGLSEKIGDYLLCRTKRKKDISHDQQQASEKPGMPEAIQPTDATGGDKPVAPAPSNQNNNKLAGPDQKERDVPQDETQPQPTDPVKPADANKSNDKDCDEPEVSQPKPPAAKSWWDSFFPPKNEDNPQPPQEKQAMPSSSNDFINNPCQMPRADADRLSQELLKNKDGQLVNKDDKALVDYMINRMVYANNDATVQLAQAGLQAFKHSKNAQSNEERDYHMQQARGYQDTMKKSIPISSIGEQANSIKPTTIDTMIQGYAALIQGHQNSNSSGLQFTDPEYIDRMKKRHDALIESKEQLRTNKLPQRDYKMNSDTRGYLMANNLNYATFDSMAGTSYQHCLAQENLDLLEASVDMARSHSNQPGMKAFSNQLCDLAISSQQLNQQSKIELATAVTDLNTFFVKSCASVLGVRLPDPVAKGIAKGSSQSLYNWATFAGNVATGDEVTLKKISDDLTTLGANLVAVAKDMAETYNSFVEMPKQPLSQKDFIDQLQARQKASQESLDKAVNVGSALLHAGQNAIIGMMQKSVEDNIAGIAENIVDGIILGKIAQGVGFVTGVIGEKCIEVAGGINMMPPHLLDATPQFINGQAVVLVAGQSINLGEAVAAGAQGLLDPLSDAAILAAQANNLYNKAKGSNNGANRCSKQAGDKSKPAAEPIKGSPEYKEKYPKGEFRPSAKHHENSPDHIGKPPRDGQAALNNSFDVKESSQRVAIQDDKVVVLKFEEEGFFHGYIVEDITTLPKKVRETLVAEGFMKDATSKKLTIK